MAKKQRSGKTMKIFRRVYSPVYHAVEAARNATRYLFRGSEKVVNTGLGTVQGVGSSVAKHADETIRDVFSRRRRRNATARRRAQMTRRNRRTRRH
jgi:hypothetical protein